MKPTWCTFYSQCISSILFITSTCFRPLQVHHQEEQLYVCKTWYLLFCIAYCLVCRMEWLHPAYQSAGFIYKIRIVLWLGRDCSAPYPFWFMSHVTIWCCIARDTASKIKWIRKYYMESSLQFVLFYIFWSLSCCSFAGAIIVFTYSVQTLWITCMCKACSQQLLGFYMFELCYMKAYHVNVDHCNVERVCLSFTFNVCFLSEKYTCSFQVVISREEWLGRQT